MTRLLLLGLCLFFGPAPVWGAPPPHPPLVVILLPGTSLRDWQAAPAPTLHRLLATGAVAVMNTRTARLPDDHRRETPESALLTLGAGARATGGFEITEFRPAGARSAAGAAAWGDLYARRMGVTALESAWVNIQWPRVLRRNRNLGYDLLPGNLGQGLSRHGVRVVTGGGPGAFPLACDSVGVVTEAVSGTVLPRPLPPCLVWDAGGDAAAGDAVIRDALPEVQERRGQIIVLSPFVSDRRYAQGARLAPVLVWGEGVPAGLVCSSSTHRAGLVTNTDFAPSVAAFFGASPFPGWLPVMPFGRPWTFSRHPAAPERVSEMEAACYRQARGMKALPFVAACLGLLLAADAFCTRRGSPVGALRWLPGAVILALILCPSAPTAALGTGLFALLLWGLQARFGGERLVLLPAGLAILTLAADMLSGNRLMQHSLLGYSAVEGARYYGIGNEAMGPLVGSALLLSARLWGVVRGSRVLVVASLLGLTLLLGLPSAGAKAGGLLVAAAAFGAFAWTAQEWRWGGRAVLAVLVLALLMLAVVSLSEWHRLTVPQSHIGGAVARIRAGGAGEGWDIIRRKLAVEGRLLYHSVWAVPLWVVLLRTAGLWRQRRFVPDGAERALLVGGTVAVCVCLAVNDAGVVAAALCGVVVLSGRNAIRAKRNPRETVVPSRGGV